MFRWKNNIRTLLLTVAAFVFFVGSANADLTIRITSFNADDTIADQEMKTVGRTAPPGSFSAIGYDTTLGDPAIDFFDITIASNIAVTGSGQTDHSHTINITYTGGTGASSNRLVIEFIGTDYVIPLSPPDAFITSNASPSTSGLRADTVTMVSGVSTSNAGLPGTVGDTSGLGGLTSGTGTMGTASSVLVPNPVTGALFPIGGPAFSFYQAFTFDDFVNSSVSGSLSAGSTVTNVPVPPTFFMLLAASPALAAGVWRKLRRNRQQAQ